MLRDDGGSSPFGRCPSEFDVASALTGFRKAGRFQLTFDFAERERLQAATSTSTCRTCGAMVAAGGAKCSSNASLRFSKASASLAPCEATSTSRHCAMNHSPSCQTEALKFRFMVSPQSADFSTFARGPRTARSARPAGGDGEDSEAREVAPAAPPAHTARRYTTCAAGRTHSLGLRRATVAPQPPASGGASAKCSTNGVRSKIFRTASR